MTRFTGTSSGVGVRIGPANGRAIRVRGASYPIDTAACATQASTKE